MFKNMMVAAREIFVEEIWKDDFLFLLFIITVVLGSATFAALSANGWRLPG